MCLCFFRFFNLKKTSNTTLEVVDSDTDTDAQASPPAPFSDPATKYRHHLNCTVTKDKTDAVEKARTEWIEVHGRLLIPRVIS